MIKLVLCGIVNIDDFLEGDNTSSSPGGNISHVATAFRLLGLNNQETGILCEVGTDYNWHNLFLGFQCDGIFLSNHPCNRVIRSEERTSELQ